MTRSNTRPPRIKALLLAALLAISLIALGGMVGPVAAQGEYTVTVTVTDQDNNPIEDATVTMGDRGTETDASGEATLELNEGTYDLRVLAPGYDSVTQTETIDSDTSISVVLTAGEGVGELRDTVAELQERAEGIQDETEAIAQERDELADERDRLQAEIEETDQQIADLEARLDEIDDESLPGFGPLVALVAILSIGFLAARRR